MDYARVMALRLAQNILRSFALLFLSDA